jgi:hypothetical protein
MILSYIVSASELVPASCINNLLSDAEVLMFSIVVFFLFAWQCRLSECHKCRSISLYQLQHQGRHSDKKKKTLASSFTRNPIFSESVSGSPIMRLDPGPRLSEAVSIKIRHLHFSFTNIWTSFRFRIYIPLIQNFSASGNSQRSCVFGRPRFLLFLFFIIV